MHIKTRLAALLAVLIFTLSGSVGAFAMDTGFSTEMLPKDDKDTFLQNINIFMLADEPKKEPIECLDVSENGLIAIGCGNLGYKTVCIYTGDGAFQYGYGFECSGSFGVGWDEDNLIIYFVRSDVAVAVDPMGEVESILEIQDTSENNSYWHQYVFSAKRTVGDRQYSLKNDMGIFDVFLPSYSKLVATDTDGAQTVLYDAGGTHVMKIAGIVIAAVLAFVIILAANRHFRLRGERENDGFKHGCA